MNNNKYILLAWYSDGGKPTMEIFSDPLILAKACYQAGYENKLIIVNVVAPNGDVVAIYDSDERKGQVPA